MFLDRLSGPPTDDEAAHPSLGWGFDVEKYGPPPPPPIAGLPEPLASAAALARLLEERVSPNRVRDVERLRLMALRAIRAAPPSPDAVRYLRERRLGLSRRGFVSDIAPQTAGGGLGDPAPLAASAVDRGGPHRLRRRDAKGVRGARPPQPAPPRSAPPLGPPIRWTDGQRA